jgi:4-carboxymuconolactone decarboxylase
MAHDTARKVDPVARDKEILGPPPRIAPLKPEEFTPDAMEITQNLRKAAGAPPISHVPDYLATILRHPSMARANLEMGRMMLGEGTIPMRDREIVILRNAWLLQAPYEWGEHVKIGRRYGLSEDEVERCKENSSAPGWNEHERALCRVVEELYENASVSDETWATLSKTYNQKTMIELLMMIGSYTSTAFVQNALRTRPDPGNNGLATRWKDFPPPAPKA